MAYMPCLFISSSYDFIFIFFGGRVRLFCSTSDYMKFALVHARAREMRGTERTDGHNALHRNHSYLIVDATPAVDIIMSRHEWQIAHKTCILAALLGAHFPNAATTARFVLKTLIIPLYTPDKAGGIGAFETPGRASKQSDAVYRIGWKNSRRSRGMTRAEYFGPLPVLVRRLVK